MYVGLSGLNVQPYLNRVRGVVDAPQVQAYLHTRTVLCPSCTGLIPLAPNWKLSPTYSIRLLPDTARGLVGFEVVGKKDESAPTVRAAIAVCPLCGTTTRKGYLSEEARARGYRVTWQQIREESEWPRTTHLNPPDGRNIIFGEQYGRFPGRMGSIEYCHVWRDWYPIYRAGKPPKQGKSPMRFTVPGTVLWNSHVERQRCLVAKEIPDPYLYTAPETAWLFDENYDYNDPNSLIPGLSEFLAEEGISDVEWEVAFPPPYREVR